MITEVCGSCDIGTFQPQTGQVTCVVCPVNMTTTEIQATSETQCKGRMFFYFRFILSSTVMFLRFLACKANSVDTDHYVNRPIQYAAIFKVCKNDNFI